MSIGRAASECGVSPHTLRYYELVGAIPAVGRDVAGRRRYRDTDLAWVRYATCLRGLGMRVGDIALYVSAAQRGATVEQAELLQGHLDVMRARRTELDHFIDVAARKVVALRNGGRR